MVLRLSKEFSLIQELILFFFDNECYDNNGDKCLDPDFYLNFRNIIQDSLINESSLERMGKSELNKIGKRIETNDDAPCTSSGYGKTEGWDPLPPTP